MQATITPINLLVGLDREADRQDHMREALKPDAFIWVVPARCRRWRPAKFVGWLDTGGAAVDVPHLHGGAPRRHIILDLAFMKMA